MKTIVLPLNEAAVKALKVGEVVLLQGKIVTARDRAHKWLYETFIGKKTPPSPEDLVAYERIKMCLAGGAIYHCGPIVKESKDGWEVIAAGPTTSEREEPYEAPIMQHFSVRAVIGKGGMGKGTLRACQEVPAVYLHAVGGAAVVAAKKVKRVLEVFKLNFGMPEAMWVFEVEDFPVIVTMDAKGESLHEKVFRNSEALFCKLISG